MALPNRSHAGANQAAICLPVSVSGGHWLTATPVMGTAPATFALVPNPPVCAGSTPRRSPLLRSFRRTCQICNPRRNHHREPYRLRWSPDLRRFRKLVRDRRISQRNESNHNVDLH